MFKFYFGILVIFFNNLTFSVSVQVSVSGLPTDGYLNILDSSGNFGFLNINSNNTYTMPNSFKDNKNHLFNIKIENYGYNNLTVPIPRFHANSWGDNSGDAYIFGGQDSSNYLNDFWYWSNSNKKFTRILPALTCNITKNKSGSVFLSNIIVTINCDIGIWPSSRSSSTTWKDSNGNLYMFGGDYKVFWNYFTNDLWKWNGNIWTLIETPTSITARALAQIWYISDKEIYLFSGLTEDWPLDQDFWKWDGSDWVSVPVDSGMQGRLAAVTWKDSNNIYMYGGWSPWAKSRIIRPTDLWIYNFTTKIFTNINTIPNNPEVTFLSQKITDNCTNPYFYLPPKANLTNILTWDTVAKNWVNFATNVPNKIFAGASAWCDSSGNLYMFAGEDLGYNVYNQVLKFNKADNTWDTIFDPSSIN